MYMLQWSKFQCIFAPYAEEKMSYKMVTSISLYRTSPMIVSSLILYVVSKPYNVCIKHR